MKRKFVFMTMLLTFLVVSFSSCDWIKEQQLKKDLATEVYSDTVTEFEYTVYDVVAQRRAEIENIEFEKAYYDIPEPILIAILSDIGVTINRREVVITYETNKDWYDGILTGVNKRELFKPDTIPNKAPVDVTQQVIPNDSIKK